MNVADSQRVAAELENLGYTSTTDVADADVIVMNTCVVRQSAEDKAQGRLSSLKPIKRQKPDLVINLMGCMVGIHQDESLKKRFPYVDVFSPPSDATPLIHFLLNRDGKKIQSSELERQYAMQDGYLLPKSVTPGTISANVPIVLGCSHACAYCVIPSRRGREISRSPDVILREVKTLITQGVKEVTLLGQIVDRYGKDQTEYPDLSKLLEMVHDLSGLERIRFLTSHPLWMTRQLIETVARLPKLMPHIEVPVQAGDDEVLRRMRRGYTSAQYVDLVELIRGVIQGCSIGTDVIVGFPGESEEQFGNTVQLLEKLKLDVVHLARYSPRPGTVSADMMEDDVSDEEKWQRFREIESLQEKVITAINTKFIGKTQAVLVEGKSRSRWRGRTPGNRLVFFDSDQDALGQVVNVRIKWAGPWSMIGELESLSA